MQNTKRTIMIYIHPDQGLITPMELDVSAIEMEALKTPAGSHTDEAGAREIAKQIRKKFPEVSLENQGRKLALLMRRMSNFEIFNGVVLRLGGVIKDANDQTSMIKILSEKVNRLQLDLTNERRAKESLQIQSQSLQRFKGLYEALKKNVEEQRSRLQRAEEEAQRARKDALLARDNEMEAIQQISQLETRLQLAEQKAAEQKAQEQPVKPSNEKEFAELRWKVKKAQDAEQQLRSRVTSLEQENIALRDELQKLVEGTSSFDISTNEVDVYSL